MNGCLFSILVILKVPYHEKHVFSGLCIYKLVLPEPANSKNEESKRLLHGLCSSPTGKTKKLFRFSSFRYITKGVIYIGRPPLRSDRRYPRGGGVHPRGEVRCVQR